MVLSNKNNLEHKAFNDFALLLIILTKDIYKIINNQTEILFSANIVNNFPIKEWLKYYRNHRLIVKRMVEILIEDIGINSEVTEIILNLFRSFEPKQKGISKKSISLFYGIKKDQIDYLLQKINQPPSDINFHKIDFKTREDSSLEFINDAEIVFLWRVVIPCWFLYGNEPAKIFRKARQGDVNSICNLLRLDKTIVYDRKISEIIVKLSMNPFSNQFEKIGNAFKGKPYKISYKKFNNNRAALISKFFSNFGIEYTAPRINALFDQAYGVLTNGNLVDPAFILLQDSFYRNIIRNRSFWKIFPDPDKK